MAARDDGTRRDKPFRLLDLPAELWSKVGRLVIQDTNTLGSRLLTPDRKNQHIEQPPITRTCRILRAELLQLYYQTRVHCIVKCWHDVEQVEKWLKVIGPENRNVVRGLEHRTPWPRVQEDSLNRRVERMQERWGVDLTLELAQEDGSARVYRIKLLS